MVHLQQKLTETEPIAGRTWCSGVDPESHMVTSTNGLLISKVGLILRKFKNQTAMGNATAWSAQSLVTSQPSCKAALGGSGQGPWPLLPARPAFALHFKSEAHHEVSLMGRGSTGEMGGRQ